VNWLKFSQSIDKKRNLEIISRIQELAIQNNTTLYSTLLSAYYILLQKYTNQNNIILGTPTANRYFEETKDIIGFFVNTLPLNLKFKDNDTILTILNKVNENTQDLQTHQDVPFEQIVEELKLEKDTSRHPVYQTLFNINEFESKKNFALFTCIDIQQYFKVAKFDLSLTVDTSKKHFKCNFNFAKSLFDIKTIKRMANHFTNILNSFISNINIPIRELNILSSDEYQKIIYDWNKTEVPYPSDKTIHQLFEEQVKKTPDNIAVVFDNQKLSYRELNNRANQLAHTIRKEYKNHWNQEVKGDTLIGIYIDRNLEMIVVILGILKSGAAYVPFDEADPEERLKFKINDCDCKMILTSSKMVEDLVFLTELDTLPVSIDSYWKEIEKAPITNLKKNNKSTDLAYVIYTSGSTGNPKGTMIEHKSVINLLYDLKSLYNLTDNTKKVTEFTSYNWDVSVSEIFSTIHQGGTLYLLTDDIRKDPASLSIYIIKQRINFLYIPPAILSALPKKNYPSLKKIIFAGEPCNLDVGKYWATHYNLYNYFGPTEATIYSTGTRAVPFNVNIIGKPLSNIQNYILDNNFSPVPIGVPGELYLSGECLARGYLNRLKLTSDAFIKNPFIANQKMYKTGDLCRWTSNVNIEFLKRIDSQIKIRGFRVELTEIETKLCEYSKINQCIVNVHETEHNKALVAYYTLNQPSTSKHQILNDELKNYLSLKLPDYMIPSTYVELDTIPLNTSGKINKKALPKPNFRNTFEAHIPAKTKLEQQLVEIWEKLLGIENIGTKDNFFELGGNSLLTIKLKSEISKQLNKNIEITDLFTYTTIEKISSFLTNTSKQPSLKGPALFYTP
jgi:amino acid adenylation domain-containing protein